MLGDQGGLEKWGSLWIGCSGSRRRGGGSVTRQTVEGKPGGSLGGPAKEPVGSGSPQGSHQSRAWAEGIRNPLALGWRPRCAGSGGWEEENELPGPVRRQLPGAPLSRTLLPGAPARGQALETQWGAGRAPALLSPGRRLCMDPSDFNSTSLYLFLFQCIFRAETAVSRRPQLIGPPSVVIRSAGIPCSGGSRAEVGRAGSWGPGWPASLCPAHLSLSGSPILPAPPRHPPRAWDPGPDGPRLTSLQLPFLSWKNQQRLGQNETTLPWPPAGHSV